MAEPGGHDIIIVKRHEEEEHESHSSAWKVAHADFMTAMMAFFLIMWLINVTDDKIRKGISQYFNPIHLSEGSTDMKGLNKPEDNPEKDGATKGHGDRQAESAAFNPVKLSQGLAEQKKIEEEAAAAPATKAENVPPGGDHAAAAAHTANSGAQAAGEADKGGGGAITGEPAGAGEAKERTAFQDPYAVLAQLAKKYSDEHPLSADAIVGDERKPGLAGGEIDRDPFDPAYWQLAETPPARTEHPGDPALAAKVPATKPDAAALAQSSAKDGAGPPPGGAAASPPPAEAIPGSPPAKTEVAPVGTAPAQPAALASIPPSATVTAEAVKAEIGAAVKATMGSDASPKLTVTATGEGVLIDLTDNADFSMFEVGSAVPNGKVVVLMAEIAKVIASQKGDVVIRGHTDGRPFHSDLYDNWRLSAARAHMAYYMLTRGGVDEKRVLKIEGYADHDLKVPADPYAAENRRIEILLTEPTQ